MTARVFVVDGHPLFRAGVRQVVEDAADLEMAGEATTGEEAVAALRDGHVVADVVLMDLLLPGCSGIEATRAIVAAAPAEPGAPRVLFVSGSAEDDAVVAALRAGARGYLVKGVVGEELVRGLRTVAQGGAVFSAAVADRLGCYFSAVHELPVRAAFPDLTEREREVLDLVARGLSNRRIARELALSEKTVRNHVSRVFAKLRVADRVEAAVRARDAGLGA
ncbi:LuxR C-terminal-related transcriptional regulator [Streptomyces silvensis]|uniref:LuxR family transcriptional regulator n=1 Tax=Streptomyces silvensis TaxID=1765722 RepID=A0A0W7X8H6_9ACTN|nr:response regulator transcription factor [Streptomyces silvensis]KUF19205.1 LuxR family transcriptional regulator [Streptomyces silvensis]